MKRDFCVLVVEEEQLVVIALDVSELPEPPHLLLHFRFQISLKVGNSDAGEKETRGII